MSASHASSPGKIAKNRVDAGGRKAPSPAVAGPKRQIKRTVLVTEEQRRQLIEDAAYFRAERYRRVEPGNYRDEDRCQAESEIEAVIRRSKI